MFLKGNILVRGEEECTTTILYLEGGSGRQSTEPRAAFSFI